MKTSAGILPYRRTAEGLQFFLVHPGGPIWAKKDLGAWSIAKGEYGAGEDPFAAALREFEEETGIKPTGDFLPLQAVRLASGKLVQAWGVAFDLNAEAIASNTFAMEWPPKSGTIQQFPEVDRAGWFSAEMALAKINPAQQAFIFELNEKLSGS